jgi:SAM-dependent methyltransferase
MEDSAQVVRDVVEWDVANWSRALKFWRRTAPLNRAPLTCLELGARRGGLSLWLALQGHRIVCSDLEDNRAVAAPLHDAYGVGDRITYEAIDAANIPYESHFDVIAFKSLLGGVAWDGDARRQAAAVRSMYRALKPGGFLLFAENLRGSHVHQALRKRFVSWNSIWRYVSVEEMLDYLKPFADVQYATTGVIGLCGRSLRTSTLLGKIDGVLLDRLVPPRSRYIMYGTATK